MDDNQRAISISINDNNAHLLLLAASFIKGIDVSISNVASNNNLQQIDVIGDVIIGRPFTFKEQTLWSKFHVSLTGLIYPAGRSGLVVTRLPAAREDPGSNRAAGKSLCFHENHCDTQLWARAAHLLQCLGRLSLSPSEGR